MKKIYQLLLPLLAAFLVFDLGAQTFAEKELDFLPKYPTASERAYIDAHAQAKVEAWLERGEISAEMRQAGTCEFSCGEQSAPESCWCDEMCVQFGDCCDDYAQFCLGGGTPPTLDLPEGLVVPGEFEESQAVLLRWPYSSTSSSRSRLYAGMIDAIQQEVPAWIMISNASDSISVKNTLNFYGVTLTSYEFMVVPTNSIWVRDYGPWGFYYSDEDSLAFIDMQYYPTRPLDNAIPQYIANYLGVDNYTTDMYEEGGNLMVDGFANAFHGDGIFPKNQSLNGWSTQVTRTTHQELFNTVSATETERLLCDGGTGHIDMYAKLIDEQTMIVSEYPAEVTASDRQRIEDNVQLFEAATNTFGGGYGIIRLPMPRRDNGSYSTSCNQIDADARGYVNGLFVNKTILIPIYSNESSSQFNRDWDEAALDMIREAMPGYNVVGLDARSLTTAGGAIHCVAMQIPAFNPIRFRHNRLAGVQPAQAEYAFSAEIKNASGIASASLFWKEKSAASWNEVPMTGVGSAFSASIINPGFTTSDTIVYYLNAVSNNGKEMNKPMVAPEGYFEFYFDENFTTTPDCAAPTNLFVTNIGTTTATFNWTPVVGAQGYVVQGTLVGNSNFQTAQINNGSASSLNVNILQAGNNYQWQVRTICADGSQSDWSALNIFATEEVSCAKPTGLIASNITTSSATFSWNPVAGAASYRVRGRPAGATGYQTVNVGGGTTSLNTGNQLQANTSYEWSVQAFCEAGNQLGSGWAPSQFFNTPLAPATNIAGSGLIKNTAELEVYPNPAGEMVNIRVSGVTNDARITLRDMTGRMVKQQLLGSTEANQLLQWSVTDLARGMYLVELITDEGQTVNKLVLR